MENKQLNILEMTEETRKEKIIRYFSILVIILCPLALLFSFKVVTQYKRAVVLRFGRVRRDSPAGPGIIWVVPCTDSVISIDLRTQSFNLLPQEVLTKDSVTVTVDAVVYYHVVDTLSCLLNVQSHKRATNLLAVATLRNILGQYTLTDLLTKREIVSHTVRQEIDKCTKDWGVEVERVEIKDVILPFELQKAMAAEAEGTRIGKAKIIEAEGEIKAAENLRDATRIMMEKPQTMILRYLQTLNFITSQQKTSIIFPFPIDIPNSRNTNNRNKFHKNITALDNPNQQGLTLDPLDKNMEKIIERENSKDSYRDQGARLHWNKDESNLIEKMMILLSIIVVIMTLPFSLLCIFVVSRQFERVVILRNGKVHKNQIFGPGLIFFLPCVDTVKFIDLRITCYEVPPQEALTKDSLTVSVDAVVFYKIYDPIQAVINIADYKISTHFLAATTLRNALGTRNLSEVLTNRPAVSKQVFESMKHVTKNWGVAIVRVEIKNISLPLQLQKAMAAEAESAKLANAKIIVAKAEIEAVKNLQVASEMLMENPMCMQLRYLQSLQTISGENSHTIVFPFSVEQIKNIFGR